MTPRSDAPRPPEVRLYAAPIPAGPKGPCQHAAGMSLLRRALTLAGLDPNLTVARLPGGKPFLPDAPDFHVNLSHSGSWAVCAVSHVPLGVDIQLARPVRPAVAERFPPPERAWLASLPPTERERAFFDLWVLKESYWKATGLGLAAGLAAAAFTTCPVTLSDPDYRAALIPFPAEGYHLAVCVRGTLSPEVRLLGADGQEFQR